MIRLHLFGLRPTTIVVAPCFANANAVAAPIPEVAPGYYTLELTVEDRLGEKFGSASINFRVR